MTKTDEINTPARDWAADRAVCDAATAGPWKYDKTTHEFDEIEAKSGETVMYIANYIEEDAVFASEARTGWPAALDHIQTQAVEIERLRTENQRYRQALVFYADERNYRDVESAAYSDVSLDEGYTAKEALDYGESSGN